MKIKIDNSTYIILLIAFVSGYFEYMYLFLLTIFVHESGHVIFGKIVNFKYSKIIIYPFGGLTIYNENLNISSNKELFSLFGGIVFQLLFFCFICLLHNNLFITDHVFNIIKKVNIVLISFNFLPILPLDGGRLLNIILDKFFSYKLSHILSIIVSIIFIIIFCYSCNSYFSIILSIFLIKSINLEIKNINSKYNMFLLERYLNDFPFKKSKYIKNIKYMKRDYYHYINNRSEKFVLYKLFNK